MSQKSQIFATCLLQRVTCRKKLRYVAKFCNVSQKIAKSLCTFQKIAKRTITNNLLTSRTQNTEQPKPTQATIYHNGIISNQLETLSRPPHLSSRTSFNLQIVAALKILMLLLKVWGYHGSARRYLVRHTPCQSSLNVAVVGCLSLVSLHSSSIHPSSQAPPMISADANPARSCHDHFYSYHPIML
jgi:hypothetical protein